MTARTCSAERLFLEGPLRWPGRSLMRSQPVRSLGERCCLILNCLETGRHAVARDRLRPHPQGLVHGAHELIVSRARLLDVPFGKIAHLLRDFERILCHGRPFVLMLQRC